MRFCPATGRIGRFERAQAYQQIANGHRAIDVITLRNIAAHPREQRERRGSLNARIRLGQRNEVMMRPTKNSGQISRIKLGMNQTRLNSPSKAQ